MLYFISMGLYGLFGLEAYCIFVFNCIYFQAILMIYDFS